IGPVGPREDAQQEHLGGGQLLADGLDDPGVRPRDGGGRVGLDVVGAEQEHDDLGGDAVELAVGDAPEDVLGAVAADAEVGGGECGGRGGGGWGGGGGGGRGGGGGG